MKTPEPPQHAEFDSTDWSLLRRAADDPAALAALVEQYWPPVYAYFRSCKHQRADAADLTQMFFEQVVIARNLPARADRSRGTFRALLKTSLRNFRIDRARADQRAHHAAAPFALDPHTLHQFEPDEDADPWDAFDRQWAAIVIDRVITRLEEDCAENELGMHWTLFEARILHPAIGNAAPIELAELARRHDLASPEQVSNMIQVVKRRFRRLFLEVVWETTATRAEADQEMRDLWAAL